MPLRIRLVVSRRGALRLGSTVTVLLACGLVSSLVRLEPPMSGAPDLTTAVVARAPEPGGTGLVDSLPETPGRGRSASERVALPKSGPGPELVQPAKPQPSVRPKTAPVPPTARPERLAEPVAPSPVPTSEVDRLARALRVDRLAESGNSADARLEAEALLAELPSSSELIRALRADGAEDVRAHLTALRVLHVAGRVSMSQDLARELKRSYASTSEVIQSIERWGVLIPRVTSVESSIAEGTHVVVTGTVENPDIGEVRQVQIVVEALDAAGSLLATSETSVRPKVLPPGGQGDFTARFKRLDPTTVLRTRTTIVSWKSEVLNAG